MAGDPQLEHPVFANLLRKHRVAADLTQEALAERAGLSARGISDLERGARTHPYRETLNLLVSALSLNAAERAAFLQAAQRPGKPAKPGVARNGPPRLPVPLNRLIGRSEALAVVSGLLREDAIRLVTLTGPGGVGKTRLALAAATEAADAFTNGMVFVDLAPLRDPSRVPDKIASALGIEGRTTAPLLETVRRFLETRHILLVLDNLEHLLAAAPVISELLQASPGVKVLVTSREPLRLHGEREYMVSTLDLPDPGAETSADALAASAAVRLFAARAVEAASDFELSPDNLTAVAAICRRLDGLPLAIELAAPRVKMLPPAAILARLEQRQPLLAIGPRDAPARQRTLRDAIVWSHDLLTPEEQALFRRLGVFVGGWTLNAAENVGGDACGSPSSVFDVLASLVDKSLVQPDHSSEGPRFTMLETIREFAVERLQASDAEDVEVRAAHAGHFGEMAEGARAGVMGADQVAWLVRLDAEDANLLAALSWTIDHEAPDAGLRFASALWRYWATRGRLEVGRDWLERALAHPGAGEAGPTARADARNALGNLLGDIGEYGAARGHYEEALALRRALGDADGVAGALNNLGLIAAWLGDYAGAMALHGESLELRRTLADSLGEAQSLSNLGDVMTAKGHFDQAVAHQRESLTLRESARDAAGSAYARYNLGEIARLRGDDPEAEPLLLESSQRFDALGDRLGMAYAQWSLGNLASRQGDANRAADFLGLSLRTRLEMGDKRGVIECLEGVGVLAMRRGSDLSGVRLLAMAYRQRAEISCPVPPSTRIEHDRELARARGQHGEAAVDELLRHPGFETQEQAQHIAHEMLAGIGE